MKKFIYDQIIDRENICNMESEVANILDNILKERNTVIFAPRNYGKTSIIQNIVIPEFRKKHKKSFVFFADLLGIDTIESISNRLVKAFEKSFSESFPIKNLIENTKVYLKGLNVQIQIDSLSGNPSLSLTANKNIRDYTVEEIFDLIKNIGVPSLIILDEFQEITKVNNAEALFRSVFQSLQIPIVVMGSQRHMLSEIFSLPNSPLASFGSDIELQPIAYEKYHQYIVERFAEKNLTITTEMSTYIQDLMERVPEPINILCEYLQETAVSLNISKVDSMSFINDHLSTLLVTKRKRFEYTLYNLSSAEQNVLIEIAKLNYIEKPNNKEFIAKVGITPRGINYILNKLLHNGILDKSNKGFYIADPLLKFYLVTNR